MGFLDRLSSPRPPAEPPESIDVTAGNEVRIVWPGGPQVTLPPKALRDACPCAECIEEGTGRKILDPSTIPDDIRPVEIRGVGNYAVQVEWSDGHSTGLYSWETLRRICGLDV
jgi:DUF971 family protein